MKDTYNGGQGDQVITATFADWDSDGNGFPEEELGFGRWQLDMKTSAIPGADLYILGVNRTSAYFESYDNTRNFREPKNASGIITVGSVNTKNQWVGYYGAQTSYINAFPLNNITYNSSRGISRAGHSIPDFYAPGAWIASVASNNLNEILLDPKDYSDNASYVHMRGTSMAAPHVTGLAALLLEKWNVERGKSYSTPEIFSILAASDDANNVINAFDALMHGEPVTGIEDNVIISNTNCPGGNPSVITLGITSTYCGRFVDEDPYGDQASYTWKIEATSSQNGVETLASSVQPGGSSTSWNLNISSAILSNKNWNRSSDGNIKAKITLQCIDSDNVYHYDYRDVTIVYKPNPPIVSNYVINGGSITIDYMAGGANSFKVYYSSSPGPPYNGTGAIQGNSPINMGSSTTATLSGFDFINNAYYFVITGTNSQGESDYSEEIVIGNVEVFDIIWTDVDGVKVDGNSLTKSRIRNNWYEGAASFNELPPNTDGWIEMTTVENNTNRMFGLSNYNQDASWNTIDYDFYVRYNGTIQIYESGSLKCNCGNYSAGDKIRVERQGSQILYKLNGNTIYTSTCDPNESLIADVSLYSTNSTISNAVASFPALNTSPHNVEWTDLVKVYVNGNSLTRDNSYRGWNAGAASINRLPTWTDGWIESTVQETNTYRMFGLSSSNSDPNWNTIDYNLYVRQDAKIMIYESGVYKGTFGYYNSGDKIRLERIDNQILYKLNGATLYTSSCDPSENLYSDVSMYSPGSTLYDVKSSFRKYDQYLNQSLAMITKTIAETVIVDEEVINSDSLSVGKNSYTSTEKTIVMLKTRYHEAILKDSAAYNPLNEIIISPNPTPGKIELKYVSEIKNEIEIEVLDYLNLLCLKKSWKIKEGKNTISMNLSPYKSKLFIVKVQDRNNIKNFKVLKE
ncbi:MAG: S8 family serine peptidase [Cytophagales bacterium]|nr:S8 family serine peptidase [Cytophagales bacterium]